MNGKWADIPLAGDRWSPFDDEFACVGFDFTGGTFAMQIREIPDEGGAALVSLGTVTLSTAEGVRLIYAGSDTIANHIAAGRLDRVPDGYQATDTEYLSSVGIHINETTMEGLPFPETIGEGERGEDVTLYYGLHITTGGIKRRRVSGKFIVAAGAME